MALSAPATAVTKALTPKVTVLYSAVLTPIVAAAIGLSRLAMIARPVRLLTTLPAAHMHSSVLARVTSYHHWSALNGRSKGAESARKRVGWGKRGAERIWHGVRGTST